MKDYAHLIHVHNWYPDPVQAPSDDAAQRLICQCGAHMWAGTVKQVLVTKGIPLPRKPHRFTA